MPEPVTPVLKPRARACPICGRPLTDTRHDPFCSKRCADVDLSRWLKGAYVIPGPPVAEDERPTTPSEDEDG